MQDLGKERVEERVTGVDEVDEVEAMKDEFSLRLKSKDQKRNKDLNYTTLRESEKGYGSDTKIGNQENFHFLVGLYNPKQTFVSQNRVPNQIRKLRKLSDAQDPC